MASLFSWVSDTMSALPLPWAEPDEPDDRVRSILGVIAGATLEDYQDFGKMPNSEAASRIRFAMATVPGR